ncbi:hypothetical protein L7F22_020987 [Adiantum nelumboides]|nr:hypothetical protein [Adiantum nelumboides]
MSQGLLRKDIVLGNDLVGMYARCDALQKVQKVLEELSIRSVASLSALIAVAPSHDLTRKGVVFRFVERQQQAFQLLKEKLATDPVLTLPDFRKFFESDFREYIIIHGWLMYVSFGLLFPVGALAARFMQIARKRKSPGKTIANWYQIHLWSESIGMAIMVAGVVSGFAQLGISSTHSHQRVGYALWIMIWFHVLAAFFLRPPMGSMERGVWYIAHWLMGTAAIILGFYNMYSGIFIWETVFPHEKVRALNIVFSIQIGIMAFVYFATDRLDNFLLQIKNIGNKLSLPKSTNGLEMNEKSIQHIDS